MRKPQQKRGLSLFSHIQNIIISPHGERLAYIAANEYTIPTSDRYFEVIRLKDKRVVQRKTEIDNYEELYWDGEQQIILRKWNDKFNKDKGKKEKPYIERIINIGE